MRDLRFLRSGALRGGEYVAHRSFGRGIGTQGAANGKPAVGFENGKIEIDLARPAILRVDGDFVTGRS